MRRRKAPAKKHQGGDARERRLEPGSSPAAAPTDPAGSVAMVAECTTTDNVLCTSASTISTQLPMDLDKLDVNKFGEGRDWGIKTWTPSPGRSM